MAQRSKFRAAPRRKETLGTARGVTRHAPSEREGINRGIRSAVKKYQLRRRYSVILEKCVGSVSTIYCRAKFGRVFVNQNTLFPFTFLFLVTGLTATFGLPVADLLA